jgi:hypothetical protein
MYETAGFHTCQKVEVPGQQQHGALESYPPLTGHASLPATADVMTFRRSQVSPPHVLHNVTGHCRPTSYVLGLQRSFIFQFSDHLLYNALGDIQILQKFLKAAEHYLNDPAAQQKSMRKTRSSILQVTPPNAMKNHSLKALTRTGQEGTWSVLQRTQYCPVSFLSVNYCVIYIY